MIERAAGSDNIPVESNTKVDSLTPIQSGAPGIINPSTKDKEKRVVHYNCSGIVDLAT